MIQEIPFDTQVDPQSRHYDFDVPYATLHDVYNSQTASTEPKAGNHPQFPSVPKMQLAYNVVS